MRALSRSLVLVLLFVLVLSSCAPRTPVTPTPEPTAVPEGVYLEPAPCPFDVPSAYRVECGYLVVPEDRSDPDGRTIRLAVAVFRSRSSSPAPDPVVYLEGGPGGSPLEVYIPLFEVTFAPFLERGDVVLFDQRGTGYSEPALDCPEYTEVSLDVLDENLSAEEEVGRGDEALRRCRDRLDEEGINLAAYDSAENAADLSDLRLALGYEQWNLYGISYGTRLALTAMRDHPQGIRSVVLDSVLPLQVDLIADVYGNADRALDLLFDTCAADPDCEAAYPELRQTFFALVDRLTENPARITLTLPSGERSAAVLNGDRLVWLLFESLYSTEILPLLPQIIYQAHEGRYEPLAAIYGNLLTVLEDVSVGMYYSVQCAEEVVFSSPAALNEAMDVYPEMRGAFGGDAADGVFDLCAYWGAAAALPLENQAVSSDIPTLVLSGQYDPITPPAWGELASQTLSRHFFFKLPGAGHGASLFGECPRSIVLDFLDDPGSAPAAACIQEDMSDFAFSLPLEQAEVQLEPFTMEEMGFRSVRPEGWGEVAPGTYTPSGLLTDQTAIVLQALPVEQALLLQVLETQFSQQNIHISAEPAATRQSHGLQWSLYEIDAGLVWIDLAVAEREGITYLVMLQSLLLERDVWYEAVFVPAVDAMQSLE